MNIGGTKDCYGCGMCAAVCRHGVIDIKENGKGFYEPAIVNPEKCTDCGICIRVCPWNDSEAVAAYEKPIKSFAAWSNDKQVRHECSSGGVAFEVEREMLGKGYRICAARYSADKAIVEHYISKDEAGLRQSIGSKYLQSLTVEGFKAISLREKNVVVGTPCQIDAMRRWTRLMKKEDNFLLMDFFCHGVPSMKLWKKYLAEVERKTGKARSVCWRNKKYGWHDSYLMVIEGNGHHECSWAKGDNFFTLFLSDQCLGKACYERCRYKYNRSSADIRFGDMWGQTASSNDEGVSAVAAFTAKGLQALEEADCTLREMPFDTVAEGQMKGMPRRNALYKKFMKMLSEDGTTTDDMTKALKRYRQMEKILNPLRPPKRTVRNIIFKRILGKK